MRTPVEAIESFQWNNLFRDTGSLSPSALLMSMLHSELPTRDKKTVGYRARVRR